MRVSILSLLKCAKGGISLDAVLEMDRSDFGEWMEAGVDLERMISDAMKE